MAKKGETLTIAKVVLLQLKYNMKKKFETRVSKSKSIFPFFLQGGRNFRGTCFIFAGGRSFNGIIGHDSFANISNANTEDEI